MGKHYLTADDTNLARININNFFIRVIRGLIFKCENWKNHEFKQ